MKRVIKLITLEYNKIANSNSLAGNYLLLTITCTHSSLRNDGYTTKMLCVFNVDSSSETASPSKLYNGVSIYATIVAV